MDPGLKKWIEEVHDAVASERILFRAYNRKTFSGRTGAGRKRKMLDAQRILAFLWLNTAIDNWWAHPDRDPSGKLEEL